MNPAYRKPGVLFLIYWALSKILDDLGFWVGFYLQRPTSDHYEDVVWNYDGIGHLGRDLFKFRNELIDLRYIVHNYWLSLALTVIAVALVVFRDRVGQVLAPGRPRKSFEYAAKFLWRPSVPLACIFLLIYLVQIHAFVDKVRLAYLIGVNQKLAGELNEYAKRRTEVRAATIKKADEHRKMSEPICLFYSPVRKAVLYRISNLDFLYFVLTHDGGPKILEAKLKALDPKLKLYVDRSLVDDVELGMKQVSFSKDEVRKILERDRRSREIAPGTQYVSASEPYLYVAGDEEKYTLYFSEPGAKDKLKLGTVEVTCTKNPAEVKEFGMRPIWEELQFFENRLSNPDLN